MQFRTRVASAAFDEAGDHVDAAHRGRRARSAARFVVVGHRRAVGAVLPRRSPAGTRYQGEAYHTGLWPKEPVDVRRQEGGDDRHRGQRRAAPPRASPRRSARYVYQRTPNWNSPLNNGKITAEEQAEIKASYDELERAACAPRSPGSSTRRHASAPSTTPRRSAGRFYEKLYSKRGFAKLISNYSDIAGRPARPTPSSREFLAEKIRARVDDPATAEKLDPDRPRLRHAAPADGDRLLRGLQPAQREAGRPQRDADRAHHRDRHRDQRRRASPST